MNIRSIDLQVAIPRATEASRIQQATQHQTMLQQQEIADDSRLTAIRRQQQVQSKPKSEGVRVEERTEPQNQRQSRQDEKHRNPDDPVENDGATGTDPVRGTRIDIKT